jgi:hypothetical protein
VDGVVIAKAEALGSEVGGVLVLELEGVRTVGLEGAGVFVLESERVGGMGGALGDC